MFQLILTCRCGDTIVFPMSVLDSAFCNWPERRTTPVQQRRRAERAIETNSLLIGLQRRMWATCPQSQSVGSTLSASPIYRRLLRPEYRLLGESAVLPHAVFWKKSSHFLGHAGPGVRAQKSRWWPKRSAHHGAAQAIPAKHRGLNVAPPGCQFGYFWPNAAAALVVQRGWRKEHLQKNVAMRQRQPRVSVQAYVSSGLCTARLCLFWNVNSQWFVAWSRIF